MREDHLNLRVRRKLGRKIKASIRKDRRYRTVDVGAKITGLLEAGELAEAWGSVKG